MSLRIERAELAETDLDEALEYLGRVSPRTAARLAAELDARLAVVASQPGIGRPRDDIRPGLRSIVVEQYVVLYTVTDDAIAVARILHGRRDIAAAFESN